MFTRAEILDDKALDAIVDEVFGEADDEDLLVCQYCGATTIENDDIRHTWFVGRHINCRDVFIIRCPDHIAEWALCQTREGNTKAKA